MQNLFHNIFVTFEWTMFSYFLVLNIFYLLLLMLASRAIYGYRNRLKLEKGVHVPAEFMKPFSVIVPAYNEELQIVEAVQSLLSLDYPEHEVIVCNDGSMDSTLQKLIEVYRLESVDVVSPVIGIGKSIRRVYFSRSDPRLVVLDKTNTGKADSLNTGFAFSRYPYVCAVDADSVLSRDSMEKMMQEFVALPGTVAVGGIIRLSNGCDVAKGELTRLVIPTRMIEKIQIVEYFRAFLFGRIGLAKLDVLMIISGAFGVFRRDALERVKGWLPEAIGEDMELVVGIQRQIYETGANWKVGFAPYPVCWTQGPDTFRALGIQRDRWQRALAQCIGKHWTVLFNPRYGKLGMLGFPYFFIFEFFGAPVELVGYGVILLTFIAGVMNLPVFLVFLTLAGLWGLCISTASLLLAEQSFRRYEDKKSVRMLVAAAVFENFGYRQVHAYWRVRGMLRYLLRGRGEWGKIDRVAYNERRDEP